MLLDSRTRISVSSFLSVSGTTFLKFSLNPFSSSIETLALSSFSSFSFLSTLLTDDPIHVIFCLLLILGEAFSASRIEKTEGVDALGCLDWDSFSSTLA